MHSIIHIKREEQGMGVIEIMLQKFTDTVKEHEVPHSFVVDLGCIMHTISPQAG